MTPEAIRLYAVIGDIRSCFNRLQAIANEMHRDLGVSAAMRAVMESLAQRPQRVPQIARAKGVSRQRIQVNVDALLRRGLVELRDNPTHKRSPQIALTGRGRTAFVEIRRREGLVLDKLVDGLTPERLTTTSELLRTRTSRREDLQSRRTEDE